MDKVHRLMQEGVSRGVFPGAVLYVAVEKELRFHEAYGRADIFSGQNMTPDTIFDLASLTKPLATAPAIMRLVQTGHLRVGDRLGDVLDAFCHTDKHDITLADLLCHTSGYPAHREYFRCLAELSFKRRKAALTQLLAAEPLDYRPGEKTVYSDLGYMVLRLVVETAAQMPLDRFVRDFLYASLGIQDLFFKSRPTEGGGYPGGKDRPFAATEYCPRRGRLIKGMVHDDNAFEAGGVDGQAGLFGTAVAVADFLRILRQIYKGDLRSRVFTKETVAPMLIPEQKGRRPFGFDIPAKTGSSSGRRFSARTVGHLGFTGVSMWMELDRGIIVLLFTNRIHPHRENQTIADFRPVLHDAVMAALNMP